MKKLTVCITVIMLILSVLLGFSGCRQSPQCARCDRYVIPIHRILNGGEDYFLCNDCSMYGFSFGAYYYKYDGSCFFCKNEAVCELMPAEEQDDEFSCLMLVCDACNAYKKEYGRWP